MSVASRCNELGADQECPPGQPFACGCFQNASLGQGADTMARFYALEENGQLSGSTAGGIFSSVIAYGYLIANVQCKQAFVADQTVELDCNNSVLGNIVRNENPNCDRCKALAAQVAQDRTLLEQQAHQRNPAYTEQKVSAHIEAQYYGEFRDNADGICKYVCLQCVANAVNQNLQMRLVEECATDTTEFVNAWVSGMSSQAEQEITKHQEALKSTGVQIRNQDDIKSLSISMANTIREMTQVEMLNALKQNALIVQETKIEPESTSVVIQNVSQSVALSMFQSIVSKTYTDTRIKAAIDIKDKEQVIKIETSFFDLITSLEQSVKSVEKLVTTIIGQVMITLGALLIIVLLIFAAIFFFRPKLLFGGVFSDDGGRSL